MLRGSERPPITPLHAAEWTHAIAQHVFRRQTTMAEADRLQRDFDDAALHESGKRSPFQKLP